MTKVKVKAITSFSHGNVDAHAGGTYSINKGDATELEKIGLAQVVTDDEPAVQTQVDNPVQEHQPGDVVTDDATDLLGEGEEKRAPITENKMEKAVSNKAKTHAKKAE